MAKIVIIYDSKSGFTERMGKAVVEGVKAVENVEAELLKVGKPFSVSKLEAAGALILGSPTIYGNVTQEMRAFLESVKEHKETGKLKLKGKIGGVFGSYGWDGGWVVEKLSEDMQALGIKVTTPVVSLVHGIYEPAELDKKAIQKCHELGRTIAIKITS